MTPAVASVLSGLGWSALGAAFVAATGHADSVPAQAAAFASGFAIGPAVYAASRWTYGRGRAVRAAWAVVSLAAAAFALGVVGGVAGTGSSEGAATGAIFVYGLLFVPPCQLLFFVSYANHEWLARVSGLDGDGSAVPGAV